MLAVKCLLNLVNVEFLDEMSFDFRNRIDYDYFLVPNRTLRGDLFIHLVRSRG